MARFRQISNMGNRPMTAKYTVALITLSRGDRELKSELRIAAIANLPSVIRHVAVEIERLQNAHFLAQAASVFDSPAVQECLPS